MIAWAKTKGAQASAWTNEARETHTSVDVALRIAHRDRRVAASVLAGGVAYRFFFWFLSLAVLLSGLIGLIGGTRVQEALRERDVGLALVQIVGEASQQSETASWWLLVLGCWLVLWTGYMCAKALVLVHAAVWGVQASRIRNALVASLAFNGAALGFVAAMGAVRWLRSESPGLGVATALALIVVPLAIWLWASLKLPHRDLGWVKLLPGAALVAAGVQALHLFTAWLLGPRLTNSTELYGALGIATTILFWLYIIGRLVIAGATLNASLDESRSDRAG